MRERRSAVSTVTVVVALIIVVAGAGIIGYLMLGNEGGPSSTTKNSLSQTSNSTAIETRTTSSQTTVSSQTQSGGQLVLNTFTDGADILGNFSQLTESFAYHCLGSCQPNSNGTATVSMMYVGEVQNGSHVYREFRFIFLGVGWAAISLGAVNGSTTVTELFYINQTDPEHSYSVFSEWDANPRVVGATRQVNLSSSSPTADGIILPLSSGSPLSGSTGLGIWLATVPGFHGQPTLVNQSTTSLNGTELSLRDYRFSQFTKWVNPQSQQEMIGNYTLVATFATFQGTDITFCSGYVLQFVAYDRSFAVTYTFDVTSLKSA